MGKRNKIVAGAVALFAVVALACSSGGSGGSSEDKARRDCKARGGTYQKTAGHSGRCLPPAGGWQ